MPEKRKANVLIQVIKVYRVEVEVEVGDGPASFASLVAQDAAYDLQSAEIEEQGKLQHVETDHPQFEEWVEE